MQKVDVKQSSYDSTSDTIMSMPTTSPSPAHQVYLERWWVLFIYCFVGFTQSLIWITFSPITDSTKIYYNISEAQVDLMLNWGTIVYLAIAPFCIHIGRDAAGVRRLVIFAVGCEFAAVVIRVIPEIFFSTIHPSALYFLHIGQICNALACPPISVTVTKLSCIWFQEHERTFATALAVVINTGGTAVGMVLAPAVVRTPNDMSHLLYIHLGVGIFTFLCTVVHFPAQPKTPPSAVAEQMFHQPPEPLLESLKTAAKLPSFIILSFTVGGMMGIFNFWSGTIETILRSSYSDETIGWFGFGCIISGIVGGLTHGHIAQWPQFRRRLKAHLIFLNFGACCSVIWFTLSLENVFQMEPFFPTSIYSISLSIALIGWFVGSSFPIAFELAADLTYPLSGTISTGAVRIVCNVIGLIYLFIAPHIAPSSMNLILVCMTLLTSFLTLFIHERYARQEAEQNLKSGTTDQPMIHSGNSFAIIPSNLGILQQHQDQDVLMDPKKLSVV